MNVGVQMKKSGTGREEHVRDKQDRDIEVRIGGKAIEDDKLKAMTIMDLKDCTVTVSGIGLQIVQHADSGSLSLCMAGHDRIVSVGFKESTTAYNALNMIYNEYMGAAGLTAALARQ